MNKSNVLSEEVLIAQIAKGNKEALASVYARYFPMVLNFILNNSGNEQEAKDVYQEAVIILYEKLNTKDFELSCAVKTFIYAVSRRLWLKALQRKKVLTSKISDKEIAINIGEQEENDWDKKEAQFDMMEKSLEALGEPCSTLLKDFYVHRMEMKLIAEKFGYTNAANAKNQKYKCLQRLKKLFFQNSEKKP